MKSSTWHETIMHFRCYVFRFGAHSGVTLPMKLPLDVTNSATAFGVMGKRNNLLIVFEISMRSDVQKPTVNDCNKHGIL